MNHEKTKVRNELLKSMKKGKPIVISTGEMVFLPRKKEFLVNFGKGVIGRLPWNEISTKRVYKTLARRDFYVKVKEVDEKGDFVLSRKEVERDALNKLELGKIMDSKIVLVKPQYILVEIENGVISRLTAKELVKPYIEDLTVFYIVGEILKVKILSITWTVCTTGRIKTTEYEKDMVTLARVVRKNEIDDYIVLIGREEKGIMKYDGYLPVGKQIIVKVYGKESKGFVVDYIEEAPTDYNGL